jgi:hypothetical protein
MMREPTLRQSRVLDLGRKGVSVQVIARRLNYNGPQAVRDILSRWGVEPVEEVRFTRSAKPDRIKPRGGSGGARKGRARS